MYGSRYFAARYYNARYWTATGSDTETVDGPYCFEETVMKTAGPVATVCCVAGPLAAIARTAGPVATAGGCRCG